MIQYLGNIVAKNLEKVSLRAYSQKPKRNYSQKLSWEKIE